MKDDLDSTGQQSDAKSLPKNAPLNVMVIDDQQSVLNMVKKMLYDLNFFKTIDTASDGELGWSKIKRRRIDQFDIVVTDIYMPNLDGIGLIKRCRKSTFARDIPFLVITGETKPEVFAALSEMGIRDCLIKPFSFQLFQDRIGTLLQRLTDPIEKSYNEITHLIEEGDYDEASYALDRLSEDESLKPRWLNLKGEILLGEGNLDHARECIEKALSSCDCYLTALCNHAKLEEKSGNLNEAISSLEKADAISPLMVDRKINLGSLLFEANREEEGKDMLCKAASISRDHETRLQIAEILNYKGYDKEADKIIKRLLLIRTTSVETYNKIGISLRKLRKYREAERAYLSALNYFPNNTAIYYNLGVSYLHQEKPEKACEYFTKALAHDPEFSDAQSMVDYYCYGKAEDKSCPSLSSPRELFDI